ncbi:MAG: sensor signal transduction histidine kinase [Solirubrobacterales bacterium]|nr:sensor signal transduction histidine kinase [Solirubrobacterales bacterium]
MTPRACKAQSPRRSTATRRRSLRAIITELRPASLDALGLVPALQTLTARLATAEGLEVAASLELGGENQARLPPEIETAVYRVAQEALTDVAKHARATRVDVDLKRTGNLVTLSVLDDGIGFDPAERTTGFGLLGMLERVMLVGGTLTGRPDRRRSQAGGDVPHGGGSAEQQ